MHSPLCQHCACSGWSYAFKGMMVILVTTLSHLNYQTVLRLKGLRVIFLDLVHRDSRQETPDPMFPWSLTAQKTPVENWWQSTGKTDKQTDCFVVFRMKVNSGAKKVLLRTSKHGENEFALDSMDQAKTLCSQFLPLPQWLCFVVCALSLGFLSTASFLFLFHQLPVLLYVQMLEVQKLGVLHDQWNCGLSL
jgi:hypothetical protein